MNFPIDYAEVDTLYRSTIGENLKVIAFTAAERGEGTTLISSTLGYRAAAAGKKCLLIDFNVANPQLHQKFGCDRVDWYPQPQAELPITSTATENLFLLAAPRESACRWEFRDATVLTNCLNQLRTAFEIIIFDTSPLCRKNKGNIPTETLCACADGTILTVLTGETSESKVKEATEILRSVNASLHGAVLNDRHAPSLAKELIRETHRLDKVCPKLMEKCRHIIRTSGLLNQYI